MRTAVLDEQWRHHAACARNCDPEMFWPDPPARRISSEARRTCSTCPVRWQCLQHALDNSEPGIWGGMTEQERNKLDSKTKQMIRGLARQPIVFV